MSHFPDKPIGAKGQRGFSILEALFSALILAIALLGLAGFQVVAMKDGSLIKARSVAANLAQEKLDDLRGFTRLADDPATTGVDECAAPTFCFSEIADDAGGVEESNGDLVLPAGTVSGYLDGYSIAWVVTCAAESAGSALSFGASCTDAAAKLATVTVSWVDSEGNDQSVSLQSVIYAMDPARMAGGLARAFSSARPQAGYTPIGVPDTVPVPINTGTGEYKEGSKPEPDVVSQGAAAEVSFDAVSYVSSGDDDYTATQKEEFVTVACECEFNGSGSGYTPSRMVWNDSGLEAKIGVQVTKPVGTAANGQSDRCDACCKDHHDVAGTDHAKYDPDRPDSEYTGGGNHKHYWYTQCTSGTTGNTSGCNAAKKDLTASGNGYSEVVAGAYLESCRFKRVDGIWRLWQDWRQVKMTVIPYDYLQTDANLDAYVDVIVAVVENTIRSDSDNGSTSIPSLTGRDVEFTAAGETEQLLGRALFVDRIYEVDDPTTLDDAYYEKIVALIGTSADWLNIVPFYETNLSLLIDWDSSNETKVTVTSEDIENISDVSGGYYNTFSRGKVTAVANGTSTITATARIHNSGVTGGINTSSPGFGIGAYDNSDPVTDSITVSLTGSTSNVGISGYFQRANVSVDFGTLSMPACTLQTPSGNQRTFSCNVASGSSPTLTYSSSASGYAFAPTSLSYTNVTTAITGQIVTVYGPTVRISGSITSGGGAKLTSVSATSGTCTTTSGSKSYTCDVPRGTSGYSGTVTFAGDNPTPATHDYSGQQADAVLDVTVSK